jgi:hypothetical protein
MVEVIGRTDSLQKTAMNIPKRPAAITEDNGLTTEFINNLVEFSGNIFQRFVPTCPLPLSGSPFTFSY